jgi:hypothetical protein
MTNRRNMKEYTSKKDLTPSDKDDLLNRATGVSLDIAHEVVRAVELHGSMNGRHEAYAVILEELEEFWELVMLNPAKMTLEEKDAWEKNMRKELTQTAAMCIKTIVNLEL